LGIPTLVIITDRNDLDNQLYGTFSRRQVAQVVNAGLTMFCWEIGRRIRQDILEEKRAAYGKEIVAALRRQLGWTHFKSLIPIDDPLKREFYDEMCRIEGTRLTLEEAA